MENLLQGTLQGLELGVADPALIKSGGDRTNGAPALRFSLYVLENDKPLAKIEGFRIALGRIQPPKRKTEKGGYWPIVTTLNSHWDTLLIRLVQGWRADFPTIEFPEVV